MMRMLIIQMCVCICFPKFSFWNLPMLSFPVFILPPPTSPLSWSPLFFPSLLSPLPPLPSLPSLCSLHSLHTQFVYMARGKDTMVQENSREEVTVSDGLQLGRSTVDQTDLKSAEDEVNNLENEVAEVQTSL